MDQRLVTRRLLAPMSVLLWAGWMAPSAAASSFIYPGVLDKDAAGAGQTVSRGSTSLFYNPANVIYGKFIEPDLDVSYAMVSYNYQHVNTDKYNPVVVNLSTPLATAGLSIRPVPSFAFGAAVLPLGSGQVQAIQSVPIGIAGAFQAMDIQQKSTAFKVAGGMALRLADEFTLGAGAIYTNEKTQIQLTPSTGGAPFLSTSYSGTCTQIIGGVRSELFDRAVVLGLSYRTAGVKKYQGDYSISLPGSTQTTFAGVGYEPAAIGAGLEGRLGIVAVFGELLMEKWSAGAALANNGLDPNSTGIDYVDVNNITLGAKVWIAPKHMLEAAYGIAGSSLGNGTPTPAGGAPAAGAPNLTGVTFGALDAVPRTIIAGGYRYKLTGTGYLAVGAQYQAGTRVVDATYPQPGTYSLSVISGNLGVGFGF